MTMAMTTNHTKCQWKLPLYKMKMIMIKLMLVMMKLMLEVRYDKDGPMGEKTDRRVRTNHYYLIYLAAK